eukprot:1149467-Pelagomonas_calceolata.AAC.2
MRWVDVYQGASHRHDIVWTDASLFQIVWIGGPRQWRPSRGCGPPSTTTGPTSACARTVTESASASARCYCSCCNILTSRTVTGPASACARWKPKALTPAG